MEWFVLNFKRAPFGFQKDSFWRAKGLLLLVQTTAFAMLCGCGSSAEEQQRLSREQRKKLAVEDSLALKVAVTPTLDCLPLFVASERGWFKQSGSDIRLRRFTAHMDCDTAIAGKSVELAVTDLVRSERLNGSKAAQLEYLTYTGAVWQLLSARKSRIKNLAQLDDKMVATTRFSATDALTSAALEGVKLKSQVYRIQINDVNIRLSMIVNNEIDAAWMQEPMAASARQHGAYLMTDSRKLKQRLGVIVFRKGIGNDKHRQSQMKAFTKVYNMACDSINKYGLSAYADIIEKCLHVKADIVGKITPVKFSHAAPPKDEDVENARKALSKLKSQT